jgi:hypothetical protein
MRRLHTALLSTVALVAGISTQSASAADLAIRRPLPAAPVYVSHWEGAYVSFSGGASWTKADTHFSDSGSFVTNETDSDVGFLRTTTQTGQFSGSDSQQSTNNNRTGGAVFTFTTGYNLLVWNSWLLGYQSEVSLNRNNIRLEGTGSSSSTSLSQTTQILPTAFAFTPTTQTNANNFAAFSDLNHKWTISEMARIGFLLRPDVLLYGLGGWSWAGFNWTAEQGGQGGGPRPVGLVAVDPSFTMNGPTWGVGIEKDFGWLRGFVQYKGVHYRDKDVNFSSPSNNSLTSTTGTSSFTSTTTTADTATRTFSANYAEITGGVIIPLNNFR